MKKPANKYLVKIGEGLWPAQYPNWNSLPEFEKKSRKAFTLNKISDFLTGRSHENIILSLNGHIDIVVLDSSARYQFRIVRSSGFAFKNKMP